MAAKRDPLWRATIVGPVVDWEFREGPDYYDRDGRPRTGKPGDAPKLRKRAYATVDLRASSKRAAEETIRRLHPEYADHTIEKLERIQAG